MVKIGGPKPNRVRDEICKYLPNDIVSYVVLPYMEITPEEKLVDKLRGIKREILEELGCEFSAALSQFLRGQDRDLIHRFMNYDDLVGLFKKMKDTIPTSIIKQQQERHFVHEQILTEYKILFIKQKYSLTQEQKDKYIAEYNQLHPFEAINDFYIGTKIDKPTDPYAVKFHLVFNEKHYYHI